jgi:hypothetical protein
VVDGSPGPIAAGWHALTPVPVSGRLERRGVPPSGAARVSAADCGKARAGVACVQHRLETLDSQDGAASGEGLDPSPYVSRARGPCAGLGFALGWARRLRWGVG